MNNQRLKMKMQQKLTPQQLLLMRLLHLPVTRLEQQVKEEMEKNPMLEIESEPTDEAFEPNEDALFQFLPLQDLKNIQEDHKEAE